MERDAWLRDASDDRDSANAAIGALLGLSGAAERFGCAIALSLGLREHDMRAMVVMSDRASRTPSQFAREMHLPPPTVTAMLDRLESAGMLCRSRDLNDRRKVQVRLTDGGIAVIRWIHAQWRNALRQVDRSVVDRLGTEITIMTNLIVAQIDGVLGSLPPTFPEQT